jgi:ribosomal protein S18 acetylase RimI-like enzyme
VSAYRFCRTDDIPLLVRAHEACLGPLTIAELKRDIRELGLWCSSCMVAFEGDDPVAFVYGCKRPPETLVHTIAVRPDHRRRGHGRHLLTSLSAKLAILGPPVLRAEVPADNATARALFEACGYREDRRTTDFRLEGGAGSPAPAGLVQDVALDEIGEASLPSEGAARSWGRTRATLVARKDRLRGLAIASAERLEAAVLCYREGEVTSVGWIWASENRSGSAALGTLFAELGHREGSPIVIPRVGPEEIDFDLLKGLGFTAGEETIGYVAHAGRR